MRTRRFLIIAVVVLAALATRPSAIASGQGLSADEGVRLMRAVMTPQFNPPFRHAHGDLAQVAALGVLPNGAELVDSYTATYKGYRLVMMASVDRKQFQAMLVPREGCGRSWFGSEKSVIYSGEAMGCR